MNMIVTADDNWAIGNRGRRLVSIPSDNRFVQEETQGKVVVLGRRALADLPHRQLLPDRTNLVLTSDPTCRIRGAETLPDLAHLLQTARPQLIGLPILHIPRLQQLLQVMQVHLGHLFHTL